MFELIKLLADINIKDGIYEHRSNLRNIMGKIETSPIIGGNTHSTNVIPYILTPNTINSL